MRSTRLTTFTAACLTLSGCYGTLPAAKPYQSKLDPLALQQMQTQEFETSKEILFASTVSVFQDTGFVIEAGDLATGIITGKSPATIAEAKPYYWMKITSGETVEERASAFVESIRPGFAKVRLNFVERRVTPSVGDSLAHEIPNEDSAYYERVFARIREAVFVREALNSPGGTGASKN